MQARTRGHFKAFAYHDSDDWIMLDGPRQEFVKEDRLKSVKPVMAVYVMAPASNTTNSTNTSTATAPTSTTATGAGVSWARVVKPSPVKAAGKLCH